MEVLLLGCIVLAWCCGLSIFAVSKKPVPLAHGGGTVWLCPSPHGVDLIDKEGVLRNMDPRASWIMFSLSSTLARNFGACCCNNIVIHKPTIRRLHAAASLIRAGKVQRIAIPQWVTSKKWFISWKEKHEDITVKELFE